MLMKFYWWKILIAASFAAAAAWGQTFGTVVSIGGEAADLALDNTRGLLYIADFTGQRVRKVDTSGTITTLASGKQFTTVIPGQPTTTFSAQLAKDGVKTVTALPQSSSLGSDLLYFVILLLPLFFVFYLFRRMARAGGIP